MDRTDFLGYHMVTGIMFVIGALFFCWFCWPAVCKGMLNTGNLCGMAISALMMFCGLFSQKAGSFVAALWQKKPMRPFFIVAAVCICLGLVLMIAASIAIRNASSRKIPDQTPAVVLGCAVKGTRPSRVLRERIEAAEVYLREHPQAVCVLSGGQGKGEEISEAECMYRELVRAGIDGSRLYLEAESVNTRTNLENSKKILDKLELSGPLTVISSEFHLYRGRYWAKKLGFEDYGYAAHTDWRYLPTLFLREVIAVVYLWLTQILHI